MIEPDHKAGGYIGGKPAGIDVELAMLQLHGALRALGSLLCAANAGDAASVRAEELGYLVNLIADHAGDAKDVTMQVLRG